MDESQKCPNCQREMIKAHLKVSGEDVYLDSTLGEEYSLLRAWVCPSCREVTLKAASPGHLIDPEQKNLSF